MLAAIGSQDPNQRELAVLSLAGTRDAQCARAIVSSLRDTEPRVRVAAARALSGVWHDFAIKELLLFAGSSDADLSKACLLSLSRLINA
jgi:HEAT repeat protein